MLRVVVVAAAKAAGVIVGHTFKKGLSMRQVIAEASALPPVKHRRLGGLNFTEEPTPTRKTCHSRSDVFQKHAKEHRMDISSISLWDLQPDAYIPSHVETVAHRTPRPGVGHLEFPFPSVTLWNRPEDRPLTVRIWFDLDAGYLWTSPSRVRGDDPQPDYVTHSKPNYGYDCIANRLVVRHPLTPERRALAEELLEKAAPPVEDYPVPAEAAAVFRRMGWKPDEVREFNAGWTITTADDARVWTAHSYEWWRLNRFPRTEPHGLAGVGDVERRASLPPASLTTNDAVRLLEADVRFDVIEAHMRAGVFDVDRMIAARPPQVPNEVTRVIIGNCIALDAPAARDHLERHPHTWLTPIKTDNGPHLIHIDETVFSSPWMIWSDGLLTNKANLITPLGVNKAVPHITKWLDERYRVRGFTVTAPLIKKLLVADNVTDLTAEVWMPWQSATGLDERLVEEVVQDIAVGPHRTIDSRLAFICHTVTMLGGEQAQMWEVADSLGTEQLGQGRYTERWIYTSLEEATDRYRQIATIQPPLAAIEQLAELLGVTGNAVTQAISRDRKTPRHERSMPRRPDYMYRNGRTEFFPTRRFIAWWNGRVGHGPGRGHRADNSA